MVQVYNIDDGARFETYVIEGAAGSGTIQVNGAAAHLARPGQRIIVAAYVTMPMERARTWTPKVVLLDDENRPKDLQAAA
jgi:aspartate 1-decarboxylase